MLTRVTKQIAILLLLCVGLWGAVSAQEVQVNTEAVNKLQSEVAGSAAGQSVQDIADKTKAAIEVLKQLQTSLEKGPIASAIKIMTDSAHIHVYPMFHIAADSAIWPYALELYFAVRQERVEPYILVTLDFVPESGIWTDFSTYKLKVSLTQGKTKAVPQEVILPVEQELNKILANIGNLQKYFGEIRDNVADAIRKLRMAMMDKYWVNKKLPLANFSATTDALYGFDPPVQEAIFRKYKDFYRYDTVRLAPWKSLSTSKPDKVNAYFTIRDTAYKTDKIRFIDKNSTVVQPIQTNHDTLVFSLTGISSGDEGELTAEYVQKDSTGKEHKAPLGQVKTITYEECQKTLHIIPVGDAVFTQADITPLKAYLKAAYKQAVVTWDVTLEPSLEVKNWDKDGNDTLNIETTILQRYSDEENVFVSAWEAKKGQDPNGAFLFIVNMANNLKARGYMPLNGQYGFIFTGGSNATVHDDIYYNTIAHEVGHGIFKLYHAWDDYGTPERQTNNLMDYQNGITLWKPQWDWIHDPGIRSYMFQSEDEGALANGESLYKCIGYNAQLALKNQKQYYTPNGKVIELSENATPIAFFYKDSGKKNPAKKGSLAGFTYLDITYYTIYNTSTLEFVGYGQSKEEDKTLKIRDAKADDVFANIDFTEGENCAITINGKPYTNTLCTQCLNPVYAANYEYLLRRAVKPDDPDVRKTIEAICKTLTQVDKSLLTTNNDLFKYQNNYYRYWFDINIPKTELSLEDFQAMDINILLLNNNIKSLQECNFKTSKELVDFINAHFVVPGTMMSFLSSGQFTNLTVSQRVCLIEKLMEGEYVPRGSVASSTFGGQDFVVEILRNCNSLNDLHSVIEKIKADGKLYDLLSRTYDNFYFSEGCFSQLCTLITNAYINELAPVKQSLITQFIQEGKYLIFDNGYLTSRNKEDFNEATKKIKFKISDGAGKYLVDLLSLAAPGAGYLFKDFGKAAPFNNSFDPLEFLILVPKRDITAFGVTLEHGKGYLLPALSVYLIFKNDTKASIGTSAAITINIALCTIGIGEITTAGQILALTSDISVAAFVTYANSAPEIYQDHPEIAKYSNYFAFAYATGRILGSAYLEARVSVPEGTPNSTASATSSKGTTATSEETTAAATSAEKTTTTASSEKTTASDGTTTNTTTKENVPDETNTKETNDGSIANTTSSGDEITELINSKTKISELTKAPKGYQVYEVNGRKYIRRIDATNNNLPRLTVDEDGVIVKYTGVNRESSSYNFSKNLEDAYGPMPADHQRHHLVADNVIQKSPLYKTAKEKVAYDLDRASNGRYLAGDEESYKLDLSSTSSNYPTHSGSHPKFDLEVQKRVDNATNELIQKYGDLNKVPNEVLENTLLDIEDEANDILKKWGTPRLN